MAFLRLAVSLCAAVGIFVGCSSGGRPALDDNSTRDDEGRITAPGQVGILRLRPGDCFISGEADLVESVTGVPCAMDHDGEVFAVFDLEDDSWPGATAVESMAVQGCEQRFGSATGLTFDPSIARLTAYAPTMDSWNDDRSIVCVATSPDGSMTSDSLGGAGT